MDGPLDVLQASDPEGAERDSDRELVLDQVAGRPRDENLPSVPCSHDPRRSVNAEPDVAVAADRRLARIDPDPDPEGDTRRPVVAGERPLAFDRGLDGLVRPLEGDEERVAVGVDLAAAVRGENLAQEALMGREHLVVADASEPVEELRRSLYVREEEGDRPAR